MASAGKTFRLSTSGAEQTSREFGKVGEAGRKMGADIAKGAKGVGPALRGLDTAVGQAKDGIKGFAGQAGALGGVLSSMGPIGLAAAAGIGAIGAAFFEAAKRGEQAIEWAESLDLLSQRLDTSTRSVQEWRFAASQFGVDTAKTDAALEKLNNTIGLASRGIPKALKLFQALGFTDEQIAGFRDVDSVLPQVAEKLAALEPAARAGLANKLGLSELLPLLKDGRVGVEDLKKQFEELGLVIDEGALRRAAEDNDRLDVATARAEATTQRINLALTPVASLWGEAKAAAAEYFEEVFDGFRQVEERSTRVLRRQLESLEDRTADAGKVPFFGPAIQAQLKNSAAALRAELGRRNPDAAAMGAAGSYLAAARRFNGSASGVDDEEDILGGGKGAPKTDPIRAMLESRIKTMREAQAAAADLAAVERENPGLTQDEVKARYDLLQAYKLIEEARKAGVIASDAEAQSLRDSIAADQAKAASLKERDAAQRIADERQGRADSVRQFFETPLMRMKREIAEIEDLRRGGELGDDEARRSVSDLRKEYEELARAQFEASDAGQLFGGVLKGQIRNIGDFKAALLSLLQQRLMDKLFGQLGKLGDVLGSGGGASKGSGIVSLFSKGISALFGGGRATGGPVVPGMMYKVNENTPRSEWFMPHVAGTVFTAAQADRLLEQRSSTGGNAFTFSSPLTINAPGADGDSVKAIKAELATHRKILEGQMRDFAGNVMNVVGEAKARRHPVFK